MNRTDAARRNLHVETIGNTVVLRPDGPCDMECTQVLDSIVEQIENSPGKDIILDASRVKYIDTPGFRWITDHFRKIQELGGQLVVVGLKGPAERAFRLLQLDRFIPSATNVDAALARIRKKG